MSSSSAPTRPRPKPVARRPIPTAPSTGTGDKNGDHASSSGTTSSVNGSQSRGATAMAITIDSDDDDDYWHAAARSRRAAAARMANGGSTTASTSQVGVKDEVDDAMASDSSTSSEGEEGFGKRMRTDSLNIRAGWKRRTASIGSESEESDDDSADESFLGKGPKNGQDQKQISPKKPKRPRMTPSPEVEPLPPPPAFQVEMVRNLVSNFCRGLHPDDEAAMLDQGEIGTITNNADFLASLDPDLRRLVSGPSAETIRESVRESEQRRRRMEQEAAAAAAAPMATKPEPAPTPSSLPASTDSALSARRMTRAQTQRARPTETIELSDSDDDGPPLPRATSAQHDRDSSPIEMVSFTQTQKQQAHPAAASLPTPPIPDRATSSAPIEEADRISIIMKGGDGGSIQEVVKVRPTTLVEKLLDHYIQQHRDKIPQDRLSKVRLRFDGEILKSKQTIADIDIEDEEQLDVIW